VKRVRSRLRRVWKATGNQICLLLKQDRWLRVLPQADGGVRVASSRSISNRERTGARVPLCRKRAQGRLKKKKGNAARQFDLREGLFRMTRYGPNPIDGIDV